MTPSPRAFEQLVEAVRETARAEILPLFRNLAVDAVDTKSGPDDLVTVADRRSEARIARAAADLLPGALVVGEEATADNPGLIEAIDEADCAVIIDPVDGTWNFAKGLAVFGVIIAVTWRGETVLGLLYDPICDDWIAVEKGAGVRYHRPGEAHRPVTTSGGGPSARNGFVPLNLLAPDTRAAMVRALAGNGRTHSLRCSCHEYRLLAQGQADYGLSVNMKPWDHAAGVLAMHEAGGVARMLDGAPYRPSRRKGFLLSAANEDVAAEMTALLAPCLGQRA